jgi:hypothetical protein
MSFREKNQTQAYFDEEGHYKNFNIVKSRPKKEQGLEMAISETSYCTTEPEKEECINLS